MCIMKQSDQILSRRFLCSLVLRIKRQGSVPLFCFSSFSVIRRLSLNKDWKEKKIVKVLWSEARGGRFFKQKDFKKKLFFFFLCSVSSALTDGRSLISRETILKKMFLMLHFFLNVVVFILVKMHGICYCTKIEEVNM